MSTVGSRVLTQYPPPPDNVFWGIIKLESVTSVCWRPRCSVPSCRVEASKDCELTPGRDEVTRLNTAGQLGLGEWCIIPSMNNNDIELEVVVCQGPGGSWRYSEDDNTMRYTAEVETEDGSVEVQDLCAEMRGLYGLMRMSLCNKNITSQKWIWQEYKPYWAPNTL